MEPPLLPTLPVIGPVFVVHEVVWLELLVVVLDPLLLDPPMPEEPELPCDKVNCVEPLPEPPSESNVGTNPGGSVLVLLCDPQAR